MYYLKNYKDAFDRRHCGIGRMIIYFIASILNTLQSPECQWDLSGRHFLPEADLTAAKAGPYVQDQQGLLGHHY